MEVSRNGQKWDREETILAYDLYCRTSFSKISKNNKDIIELAKILGRTPSSVGLKMANLAAYDPAIQEKNLSGMKNGSKLDKEIFQEFSENWGELSYIAQEILAKKKGISLEKNVDFNIELEDIPEGMDAEMVMKQRIGQTFFRLTVLNSYNNKCCITGLIKSELLIASHIKPWAVSDEKTERTNPQNGLCLNALHDKAFDRGLITVDANTYKIFISKELKDVEMDDSTRDWFYSYSGKRIILPNRFVPDSNFLEYHNDIVFRN